MISRTELRSLLTRYGFQKSDRTEDASEIWMNSSEAVEVDVLGVSRMCSVGAIGSGFMLSYDGVRRWLQSKQPPTE